jgi:hypothetical protein
MNEGRWSRLLCGDYKLAIKGTRWLPIGKKKNRKEEEGHIPAR